MFRLTEKPIDPAALKARLRNPKAGACVTFEGWARNHNEGRAVVRLEYEAYGELAEPEGRRIVEEARKRFEVVEARCVHRVGTLGIGEIAVWVGVSAAHRQEAFAACRYIIDELKVRLPIWKKEYYADGESSWVLGSAHATRGHPVVGHPTGDVPFEIAQASCPELK